MVSRRHDGDLARQNEKINGLCNDKTKLRLPNYITIKYSFCGLLILIPYFRRLITTSPLTTISPHTGKREYLRAINSAVTGLGKRGQKLTFLKDHEFSPTNIHFESLTLNPSPTAILNILCKQFLSANVSAILYMMNYEQYGRSTASAQYFLQVRIACSG